MTGGVITSCAGVGRPVAVELWRSYYYCPLCRKRLHAGAGSAHHVTHPNPRYTNVIVPPHKPKEER